MSIDELIVYLYQSKYKVNMFQANKHYIFTCYTEEDILNMLVNIDGDRVVTKISLDILLYDRRLIIDSNFKEELDEFFNREEE